MKKILIPIDVKHNDEIALGLAHKLIGEKSTEIILLHVVPATNDSILLKDGSLKIDNDLDFSELKTKASIIQKELEKQYELIKNISIKVIIGDVNKLILTETNSGIYDLLIIEMEDYISSSFWSESHTEYISKHAKIPVLTLKCDRSAIDLSQIVFVSDFLSDGVIDLSVLRKLAEHFNSTITLLKIVTKDQRRKDEDISEMAEQFAQKNGLKQFDFKIQKGITVEDGISKFCEINNIDLIAIGTNQRDGFSTLFRRSISQEIVRKLYHPIITFPIR